MGARERERREREERREALTEREHEPVLVSPCRGTAAAAQRPDTRHDSPG